MNEFSTFLSDPKVILSIFALLISIVSLIWTIANQREENHRWDKLNSANIVIKEARMTKWKELTKDEAMKTDWGYEASIYSSGETSDVVQIPYHLVARDLTTKEKVIGVNPVFTIQDVREELIRVGYKNKVFITRLFRPRFVFENIGKTDATDLLIEIDAKLPNEDWKNAFKANTLITLAASQTCTVTFDIELPIGTELPEALSFKVHLTFKDIHKEVIKRETKAKWTSSDNYWSYGEA
jgi:hypothetical protein